ncbi:MAG: HDOD domain-containing protein [Myxococcota bacterium]
MIGSVVQPLYDPIVRAQLDTIVADAPRLGALPAAYHRLSEVLQDPAANAQHIAAAVRLDPDLTARLLRLVNTAAIRPPRPIDTVSQAAMRIGTVQLQQLALATSVVRMFRGMPEHLLDMASFWTHSVAVGLGTHLLGRALGYRSTESMFVSGLLHDVGTLLLCTVKPREVRNVLIETENRGLPHYVVEQQILGYSHADAGAVLLESWNLPRRVVDVAAWHHRLSDAAPPDRSLIDLVHVADVIATSLSIGNGGERAAHALDPEVWRRTRLTTSQLHTVIRDLDAQILEVVEALLDG